MPTPKSDRARDSDARGATTGARGPLIHVSTRCATIDEFVEKFSGFASYGALVLPAAGELPPGTEGRFVIRLADQTVTMRGRCRVTDVKTVPVSPAATGPRRTLLRVALLEMEEGSRTVHARLLAHRRQAVPLPVTPGESEPTLVSPHSPAPPPPSRSPPPPPVAALARRMTMIGVAPRTDPSTGKSMAAPAPAAAMARTMIGVAPAVGPIASKPSAVPPAAERRVPGAAFTLPANPLSAMPNDDLASFIDSTLFESDDDDATAERATRHPPEIDVPIKTGAAERAAPTAVGSVASADRVAPTAVVRTADRVAPTTVVSAADRAAPTAVVGAVDRAEPTAVAVAVADRAAPTAVAADRAAPTTVVGAADRAAPTAVVATAEHTSRVGLRMPQARHLAVRAAPYAVCLFVGLLIGRAWLAPARLSTPAPKPTAAPTPARAELAPAVEAHPVSKPTATAEPPAAVAPAPVRMPVAEPARTKPAAIPAAEAAATEAAATEPAATEAAATGNCTARIVTEPADAKVVWGGKILGQSPIESAHVPCGAGTVTLDRERYQPVTREVTAEPGAAIVVSQRLRRPPGTLIVNTSPTHAYVAVNEQMLGAAPRRLAASRFEQVSIRVTFPGYLPWTKKIYLKEPATTVTAQLVPTGRGGDAGKRPAAAH